MTTPGPERAGQAHLQAVLGRAVRRSRAGLDERWLFALGGGCVLAGLAAMVVGYLGTSRTVLVAGQIPYVVSGGLIGLALVFLGGFLYFGYWLALLVRDGRRQAAELARDQELLRAELSELRGALADLTRTLTPSARRARGGRA